jgi:hypothetical protein
MSGDNSEHKMDDEKIAKWTKKVTELGVPEDKVDEELLWVFKKVSFKLNLLRLKLDEKGVDESQAKGIIEKLVAHVNEKDLSEIKEWHQKHEEDKAS